MPELPEIETIRRSLEPHILQKTIEALSVLQPRLRWTVDQTELHRWTVGQRIVGVRRRAKYLLWMLSNDAAIVFHLGMSGRLGIFSQEDPLESHTHVIFLLSLQMQIRYRDPRRFGFIEVVPPHELEGYCRFQYLGPEPLSGQFDAEFLMRKIENSKRAIKQVLMDSQVVVGLGNIYANEALFHAGVHPQRTAETLTPVEVRNLVQAIKDVLTKAIEKGGTTLNDFRNAHGEPGFFQMELAVYDRKDQPCIRCGRQIKKMAQGQRSSYFCPGCQK